MTLTFDPKKVMAFTGQFNRSVAINDKEMVERYQDSLCHFINRLNRALYGNSDRLITKADAMIQGATTAEGFKKQAPDFEQEITTAVFFEVQSNPSSRTAPAAAEHPILGLLMKKFVEALPFKSKTDAP